MLLAVDIGNSHIVFGLFSGSKLVRDYRLETRVGRTADEYAALLKALFDLDGLNPSQIAGGIISSVVPPTTGALQGLFARFTRAQPVIVGPGTKTGMPILYDTPREVGADRIVNAVAAHAESSTGSVVVDFGTATTFDVVTPRGEYAGGIIAPGLMLSAESLFRATAKLPRVDVARPAQVIGKNTIASMQAGIYFGYAGLVDSLVSRIKNELDFTPQVISTGGLGAVVAEESVAIERHDELLTLKGLRIIHERNAPDVV